MKISHSKLARFVKLCALQSFALGLFVIVASEARAGGYEGYAECNQILAKDIFNRIEIRNTDVSMSESSLTESFFSQDSTKAYEAYESAFKSANEKNVSIEAEFHYGPIGGELGIDINSKNKIEKSEFENKFNEAVKTREEKRKLDTKASRDLVSEYASYIRDPDSVKAWQECVTKTREVNIYAFAKRDNSGQAYVTVMWVPGPLSGTVPTITISFVTGDRVEIIAKDEEPLGSGGDGKTFKVSCGKECDDGFQVSVNGFIKNNSGSPTSSFTASVDVPALKPPEPPKPQQTDKELMVEFERERSAVYDRCGERTVGDCKGLVEAGKKYKELEVIDSQCEEQQDDACWQRMKALALEMLPLFRDAGKGIE